MDENSMEPVVVPTPVKKEAPIIQARLRHKILKMPEESWKASGIRIFGRKIRSLVYTTDLAVIKNCDADAVFAVYPFTPQQSISEAIIDAASIPVFCGIGGGTTRGVRTVTLAHDVECQGAMGVVLNSPISNVNLRAVSLAIDIPTVITVVSADTDIAARSRWRQGHAVHREQDPREVPRRPHHRVEWRHGGVHARHGRGRRKRRHIHPSRASHSLQADDGPVPQPRCNHRAASAHRARGAPGGWALARSERAGSLRVRPGAWPGSSLPAGQGPGTVCSRPFQVPRDVVAMEWRVDHSETQTI